ncbi:coactivator CBP, KIX domain-containing protein [Artemisia annua]|uniref:Coactivator CBP, KIX domain-containing protein n=1 Tax=Artemisia annua TaxID=35608 RepID=A0A2U1MYY9_ARTAN|nr:coactivator CBP, KIX domain-containing protein [Artemisia annua]
MTLKGLFPVVNSLMEPGDSTLQLPSDARQRVVAKMINAMRRHLPLSEHEIQETAVMFEEKVYTVATSRPDYLRRISLKMLFVETRSENPMQDIVVSVLLNARMIILGVDHKDGVVVDPPQDNASGSNQPAKYCKCGDQAH